jgi:hypothetical protein
MGPTRVLAALMGGLMLAGCTDGDRYENRTYAYDGWGNRSGGYYGYPSRYYGYPYRYYDNRRYYDHDHDDDDDDDDHDHDHDHDRADRDRSQDGRSESAGRRTSCDDRTQVCYKGGKLNTAETRDEFGRDAARRTTRLRERYDTKDIYLPRRNVVCDGGSNTCYRGGEPDRQATRDQFGRKAARKIDKD